MDYRLNVRDYSHVADPSSVSLSGFPVCSDINDCDFFCWCMASCIGVLGNVTLLSCHMSDIALAMCLHGLHCFFLCSSLVVGWDGIVGTGWALVPLAPFNVGVSLSAVSSVPLHPYTIGATCDSVM